MKKSKEKKVQQFLNQGVRFFDPNRGFWRSGVCYKETKQWVSVRFGNKHRRKVPNSPDFVRIAGEDSKPMKADG